MDSLAVAFHFHTASDVQGPEIQATWATFSLSLGTDVLTQVFDHRSRTVRPALDLPLYPLAEWLATHWWSLRHESETPEKTSDPEFASRHCLAFAREGYALPRLRIVPVGSHTRLAWERELLPASGLEFLGSGDQHVPTEALFETLADLVNTVVRRLGECSVSGTLLQQEWAAVQAADEEESAFCAAAAALGLDPYAASTQAASLILELSSTMQSSVFTEFLLVASKEGVRQEAEEVRQALQLATAGHSTLGSLADLCRDTLRPPHFPQSDPPWRQGYALARELRRRLGLNGEPLPTHQDLARALGVRPEDLQQAVQGRAFPTRLIEGVVATNDDRKPVWVVCPRSEEGTRFLLCRGIAELLCNGGEPALLSRASSERQARNRAFAAEFLAPSAGLRDRAATAKVGEEEVSEFAEVFGVSALVIDHQLRNHHIAQVVTP
ncbi:MAG: ImmA/IrrE family metallo-endopeptidase [Candidatus Latescibacterota bacterium]